MSDPDLLERMRADWNERARADAHYYVAFGRHDQDDAEFLATAADVVRLLEAELPRLTARERALEIGCGPGRLMRPLSRHFGEIHGVDVSDKMVRLATETLRGVSNARVHASGGSDLRLFPDEFFDFVYSYAVFQHIPSRAVVFDYLAESRRVLKTGGILRCQINGLPQQAARYTTWEGVRISGDEVAQFAREHDLQMLALEGVSTQYMWTTWCKQPAGWRRSLYRQAPSTTARVRHISNAQTGEPMAPVAGLWAALSLWVEQLPADADLIDLEASVDARPGRLSYIGPPQWDGICQLNVAVPEGTRTGLVPVDLAWVRNRLAPSCWARITPAPPPVPRICSVSDGINLLSRSRIQSRSVKLVLEELLDPDAFSASIDEVPIGEPDLFCTDPLARRFEINLKLPESSAPGAHTLRVKLGKRAFAPIVLEVA